MDKGIGAMEIKAIPTMFDGVFYRSRLEARWAVYLKSMGIRYEYESQGLDIGGVLYLPDFWLPDQDIYLEIKPENKTYNDFAKPIALAGAGRTTLILHGPPCYGEVTIWMFAGGRFWPLLYSTFGFCTRCKMLTVLFSTQSRERGLIWTDIGGDDTCDHHRKTSFSAFEIATKARFEHGETPQL